MIIPSTLVTPRSFALALFGNASTLQAPPFAGFEGINFASNRIVAFVPLLSLI